MAKAGREVRGAAGKAERRGERRDGEWRGALDAWRVERRSDRRSWRREGVFRFERLEVEGRLKRRRRYFRQRLAAEFGGGRLRHRSFMRELDETKNEPALASEFGHLRNLGLLSGRSCSVFTSSLVGGTDSEAVQERFSSRFRRSVAPLVAAAAFRRPGLRPRVTRSASGRIHARRGSQERLHSVSAEERRSVPSSSPARRRHRPGLPSMDEKTATCRSRHRRAGDTGLLDDPCGPVSSGVRTGTSARCTKPLPTIRTN